MQQLLPKDMVLRSMCFCLDDVEVPVSYKTGKGVVKDRNKETLLTGDVSDIVQTHLELIRELISGGATVGEINDGVSGTLLDGNFQAWSLLNDLFDDRIRGPHLSAETSRNIEGDVAASAEISNCRIGSWVDKVSLQRNYDQLSSTLPGFVNMEKMAQALEEARDGYNAKYNGRVKQWVRDGSFGCIDLVDIHGEKKPLKYYQVGGIVITIMSDKRGKRVPRVMTNTHYSRVIEVIRSTSFLIVASPHINGLAPTEAEVRKIVQYVISLGMEYPNGVGGAFKSARQILFLRGDKSNIMGASPASLHISGLSGVKLKMAERIADWLMERTNDRKSAINLANIYRMVLHPDSNIKEVFESIDGFKSPNPVEVSQLPRFEGYTRRALYASLVEGKHDIRAVAKDSGDAVAVSFARQVSSTSTPVSTVIGGSWSKWANIRFEKNKSLFDPELQSIPVSNKASAPHAALTEEEISSIDSTKTLQQYRALKDRLKAINDVVTTLSGTANLGFKAARAQFCRVVEHHEKFEAKYLAEGMTIDDIPSAELEAFVISDPDFNYTVLTEPKMFEVHKEVTRLFYMAEQALKVMTQVCERFTKKVISKASGVSITKSHQARRKEIEAMLNAYSGFVIDDSGAPSAVYVSFDMSEFSKKFPNLWVRIVGMVLSELSGECWMKRIDVMFRAAVVYHCSRGFMGWKSGVRGGFEGFLNFLWTLVMKIVMDIATAATGVEGILAVYSDDGLLRLYISGPRDEVAAKIVVIQGVFKVYGLIFHMDKTVASMEILEYLGVYGEKGMILPTWVKELMSYGKRKTSPGLSVVSDRITLASSQAGAIIKAGGPPTACNFLSTFSAVSTLRRLNRRAPSRALASLTIIPYSASGFRTPSLTEGALLSSISSLAEFAADLELYYEVAPAYANAIAERIYHSLKCEADAESALLSGSLLQTNLHDTSGLGVTRNLISSSSIGAHGLKDPITKEVKDSILLSVRGATNFDPTPLKDLIQSVPAVIEYNKAVAIMKSSAALKFVTAMLMSLAQGKDTKICKRGITEWINYIEGYRGDVSKISGIVLLKAIIAHSYPSYSICNIKESPRTALVPCSDGGDIITTVEINTLAKLSDQQYIEPAARFLGAQLTPESMAEGTASTEQRRNDRFIVNAARLVASNISLLYVYYALSRAFGLPCPALPSATVISGHRSGKNFGRGAVAAHIPTPYHALIHSRMSNIMWDKLQSIERADRTTYVEAARLGAYLAYQSGVDNSALQHPGVAVYQFKIRSFEDNTANPTLVMNSYPSAELIDDHTTKAFMSVIVEEAAQSIGLDSAVFASGLLETDIDRAAARAIFLCRLEDWIYAVLNNQVGGSPSYSPSDVPSPWKTSIYLEAAASVGFRLSTPLSRTTIMRGLAPYLEYTDGMSGEESMTGHTARFLLNTAVETCAAAFSEVNGRAKNVAESLAQLDVDTQLSADLNSFSLYSESGLLCLINHAKRLGVSGGALCPTLIINRNTFSDSSMSKSVRTAIQRAVSVSLQSAIHSAAAGYDKPGIVQLDTTVNFLTILKEMIRSSGHRDTPFNKNMVAIQFMKMELFIRDRLDMGDYELKTNDLDDYRVPMMVSKAILRNNAVIRGDSVMTSGVDMRACLLDQGIPHWTLTRINYILRRLSNTYQGNHITKGNAINNPNFFGNLISYCTTSYNIILKQAVSKIHVMHHRGASIVYSSCVMSPVDDASLIVADLAVGPLTFSETDMGAFRESRTFMSILSNLFVTHYTRWGVGGYCGAPWINKILKNNGIFLGGGGGSVVEIREQKQSPFAVVTTSADYTLSLTDYSNKEQAAHSYLVVNGMRGGMAVVAEEEGNYYVLALVPKGVENVNTISVAVPVYREGSSARVGVYPVKRAALNLEEIARVVTGEMPIALRSGEIASLVLSQAYQRRVGAVATVVDNDITLIAIAEIASGAWSVDAGFRVLSLFAAWVVSGGEVSKREYNESRARVMEMASSHNQDERARVNSASAAVFEWLRLSKITAGPNINSVEVLKIVKAVSMSVAPGGAPTAIYNYRPRSVAQVRGTKGARSFNEFISNVISVLYHIPVPPRPAIALIEDYWEEADEW